MKKQNKNKKLYVILAIVISLKVLFDVALIALVAYWFIDDARKQSSETVSSENETEVSDEIPEKYTRSDLILYIKDNDLDEGGDGTLELTVLTENSEITSDIEIVDENGDMIATFTNDGSGEIKGTVTVDTATARCGELTVTSDDFVSPAVSYYVTPEITDEMVSTLAAVVEDLGSYVNEQNFDASTTKKNTKKIEEWLDKDSRVLQYGENNGIVFFETVDHLIGAWFPDEDDDTGYDCSGSASSENNSYIASSSITSSDDNALGGVLQSSSYATKEEVYLKWLNNEETGQDIVLGNYQTNSKALFLLPDSGNETFSKYREYFLSVYEEMPNGIQYETEDTARDILINGDFVDYGYIQILMHGSQGIRSDKTYLFWGNLGHTNFDQFSSLKSKSNVVDPVTQKYLKMLWGCIKLDENKYVTNPENFRMVFSAEGANHNELYPRISTNFFESILSDKTFDNTFVYFSCCYGYSDPKLRQLFINHNAGAFVSTEQPFYMDSMLQGVQEYLDMLNNYKDELTDDCTADSYERSLISDYIGTTNLIVPDLSQDGKNDTLECLRLQVQMSPIHLKHRSIDYYISGKADVSGKVLFKDTEEPLANAKINIYKWQDHKFNQLSDEELTNLYTNENGEYFEYLQYGLYIIEAVGYSDEYGTEITASCYVDVNEYELDDVNVYAELPPYYAWIRDNMLPTLGYADSSEQTAYLTNQNWQNNSKWEERSGLASAAISDLNGDGAPECVVWYYANDEEHKNRTYLYMTMLTYDRNTRLTYNPETDEIRELNKIKISSFGSIQFVKLRTGIINCGDVKYVCLEYDGANYFAGGCDLYYAYTLFTYDKENDQIRNAYQICDTYDGSDGEVYSLLTYSNMENYTQEDLYSVEGNCPCATEKDAIFQGLQMIGLTAPVVEHYDTYVISMLAAVGGEISPDEDFYTYWNTDGYKNCFEYNCIGVYDNISDQNRNMYASFTDYTELQAHIEALDQAN